MPQSLRMRLGCVAVTAALCLLWRDSQPTFLWFTYSLGFAHYALALRYSTAQIRLAAETPPQILSLASLGVLSFALYRVDFPLVLYFGLHHALNEAYGGRPVASLPRGSVPRLTVAATVFQGLAYLTVLRFMPQLAGVSPMWIWVAFAVGGAWFVRVLWSLPAPTIRARLELCAPEMAAVVLVLLSLFVRVTFLQIVLFHFVLWAALPVGRIRARGEASIGEYLVLSIVTTGVFLLLSPLGPSPIRISAALFTEQFLFWSYAHITLSAALSNAHPAWLIRLFRDDGARRLAAGKGLGTL